MLIPRTTTIISISLLVISILGGVFLWWPNFQSFLDLRKDFERAEIETSQKEEYFSRLDVLSDKLKKYSGELAKVDSALAIDPSVPALFDFIKKSAYENGLAIENLNLGKVFPSKEKSRIKEISFSLSVVGSYSAFKNFLSTVYKSSRIIEIDHITFSSQEKDLFNFGLNLTTYSYLTQKQELGGAGKR